MQDRFGRNLLLIIEKNTVSSEPGKGDRDRRTIIMESYSLTLCIKVRFNCHFCSLAI